MNSVCNKIYKRNFIDEGFCPIGEIRVHNIKQSYDDFEESADYFLHHLFCTRDTILLFIMEKIFPSILGYKKHTEYQYGSGCVFAISKEYIKNIKLCLYKELFDLHKLFPIVPWAFEFIIPSIFHEEYKPKKIFKLKKPEDICEELVKNNFWKSKKIKNAKIKNIKLL